MSNNKKVLLYSGGMDSWLINKIWKPDIKLYVDIHGAYSEVEKSHLSNDVKIVDFPLLGKFEMEDKYIPLRNLYFLMIGSNYGDEVCLCATAGDWGAKDKNPEFLQKADNMLAYLWSDKKLQRKVKVCQDFINFSKSELIKLFLSNGGNINSLRAETFSCYTPVDGRECFDCYPCFRKFAILFANGAKYTRDERAQMWKYIKAKVIPRKEEGGCDGTYYTDRYKESKDLIFTVETLKAEFEK